MVGDSVSAYVQKDLELARRVMAADDEVDDLFDLVKGDLVKFISDHKGSAGDGAIRPDHDRGNIWRGSEIMQQILRRVG